MSNEETPMDDTRSPRPEARVPIPDARNPKYLLVDQYGAFVGKHSERVMVSIKGKTVQETPLLDLEHVLITGSGISLSADLIRACAERAIPISFISRSGTAYAKLLAPELTGTVRTRREQLLAFLDERGATLGKAMARGKLQNQANLLKYMNKYRKASGHAAYDQVREAALEIEQLAADFQSLGGATIDDLRPHLLNLEGRAAQFYWAAVKQLVPADLNWPGRETRGAGDALNMALNYGYGILYSQVETAVILAGLDPYAGFIHVDRSGKPSLVLDLIEEFRQMVVDRAVFALVNKGTAIVLEEERLNEATRRALAERVLERLDGEEWYEGKKHKLRTILQSQARHLATFVRREGKEYHPFVGRW
jgi:CRISPR-associated protein Cas1